MTLDQLCFNWCCFQTSLSKVFALLHQKILSAQSKNWKSEQLTICQPRPKCVEIKRIGTWHVLTKRTWGSLNSPWEEQEVREKARELISSMIISRQCINTCASGRACLLKWSVQSGTWCSVQATKRNQESPFTCSNITTWTPIMPIGQESGWSAIATKTLWRQQVAPGLEQHGVRFIGRFLQTLFWVSFPLVFPDCADWWGKPHVPQVLAPHLAPDSSISTISLLPTCSATCNGEGVSKRTVL